MAQLAQPKSAAFSEEDICIVSKANPCAVWSGTKILYSGKHDWSNASGYNYLSGESDVSPVNFSGWGEIRVPELNQLHKVFVFPKDPCITGRASYTTLTVGTTSGYPSGHGGCSGKIALIHYQASGDCTQFTSALWTSGLVDIIAFGSQF